MRKSLWVVLAVCVLMSLNAIVSAAPYDPNFYNDRNMTPWADNAVGNAVVYALNGDHWDGFGTGDSPQPNYWGVPEARSNNKGYAGQDCNKRWQTFDFTNSADLAQWLVWDLSATMKEWRIRKPGTYASEIGVFSIQSNEDIEVLFSGFADLAGAGETAGKTIATKYAVSDNLTAPAPPAIGDFIPAVNLNALSPDLAYDQIRMADVPVAGSPLSANPEFKVKLWSLLEIEDGQGVSEATKAGLYSDTGTITIAMRSTKPAWITDQGTWQ